MHPQVMLDLETLGNKPRSVIVAIGAVTFWNGEVINRFYERVDAKSCVDVDLRVDVDTVMWWLKQVDEARLEITKPGSPLPDVLLRFSTWLPKDAQVWGNGAAFDNVLLADAYDACGLKRPWAFWNDRCYRTMRSLYPNIEMDRSGTHHNALDDAESQAEHLMKIFKHISEVEDHAIENPPMP